MKTEQKGSISRGS